jgi:hypothetical protein
METQGVQEALALIQKTNAAGGGSLHENLIKLLVKVCDRPQQSWPSTGSRPATAADTTTWVLQVLSEKPSDPVDVLETALLVKKESGSASTSGSLVEPVPVSPQPAMLLSCCCHAGFLGLLHSRHTDCLCRCFLQLPAHAAKAVAAARLYG